MTNTQDPVQLREQKFLTNLVQRKPNWGQILALANNMLQRSDREQLLVQSFNTPLFTEAFKDLEGTQQDVLIMILNYLFPSLSSTLKEISRIPLDSFSKSEDIHNFIEAVIQSGLTADIERGVVFILGNTGVGKTSLVNTLKHFIDNSDQTPVPRLAGEHPDLLETEILEVYDEINLEHEKELSVTLKKIGQNASTIEFSETDEGSSGKTKTKKLNLKLVDMGGHQEYYSSSSLFISSSGVFLIAFDSVILISGDIMNSYYSSIGTYVELVWQTTTRENIRPKIALAATKVELSKPSEENFTAVLEFAKVHIASITSENNIFLLNEVLRTSSAQVTKEALRSFHRKVATMNSHPSLRIKPNERRPLSWHKFLGVLQQNPAITLEEAKQRWVAVKKEVGKTSNFSREDLEGLEKLKFFLKSAAQIQNQRPITDAPAEDQTDFKTSKSMAEQTRFYNKKTEEISSEDAQEEKNPLPHSPAIRKVGTENPKVEKEKTQATKEKGQIRTDGKTAFKVKKELQTDVLMNEMSTILSYFVSEGEVLWYKEQENLCNILITRPMELVKSLRNIITHKAAKRFQGVRFEERKRDIQEIGLISFNDFQEIYSSKAFPAKETWDFIIQLGLGIPMQRSKDEMLMMIPCLISDSMEEELHEKEKEFKAHDEVLCVRYLFDRNSSTIGLYHKFLEVFTRSFLWRENGGDFSAAFSQKVESRKLGCVGGAYGTVRWSTHEIQKTEAFNFLILEDESAVRLEGPDDTPKPFSRDRGVRIFLKPKKGGITNAVFEIFRQIDKEFSPDLKDVHRSLSCQECLQSNADGTFYLNKGIVLASTERPCTNRSRHDPPERIVELLENSGGKKPFDLDALMTQEKSTLGLEPFKSSQIKKDMEEENLEPGHQIWIYHDSETDPWNPIARTNKYAHVVIYTGSRVINGQERVHEVVHVSQSSIFKGLMKAKIRRQEVLRVITSSGKKPVIKYGAIKPNQMVFLGHKIKECQFAPNTRQKIAERALKCAEKPSIVFDYDYRNNCETFCNMILFEIPTSTQTQHTVCCLRCIFSCLGHLRCCCSEDVSLVDQMIERLKN